MKKIMLALILCLTFSAFSNPNKLTETFMNSEVSAFNFFLFQLYNTTKCNDWYANEPTIKPKTCMNKHPIYDEKKDTLELNFLISLDTSDEGDIEEYNIFIQANMEKKKSMLLHAFDRLLLNLGFGIKYFQKDVYTRYHYGLIDNILKTISANEKTIKHIKNSIIINVNFKYQQDMIYIMKLNKDKTINYIVKKPELITT